MCFPITFFPPDESKEFTLNSSKVIIPKKGEEFTYNEVTYLVYGVRHVYAFGDKDYHVEVYLEDK